VVGVRLGTLLEGLLSQKKRSNNNKKENIVGCGLLSLKKRLVFAAIGTWEGVVVELIAAGPMAIANASFRSKEESTLDVVAVIECSMELTNVEALTLDIVLFKKGIQRVRWTVIGASLIEV